MEPRLKRSAVISALAHLAVILLAIVVLPTEKLKSPATAAVDVTIIGPHVPQQALHKGKVPAPANTAHVHKAHLTKAKPKDQPKVAPPPPPPPPPPPAPHAQPKLPRPPAPAPPPPPPTRAPTPLPTPPPPP
ncbi:MAG: hypothetical protein ACP5E6_08295, partial [Acidiphilium sp.]